MPHRDEKKRSEIQKALCFVIELFQCSSACSLFICFLFATELVLETREIWGYTFLIITIGTVLSWIMAFQLLRKAVEDRQIRHDLIVSVPKTDWNNLTILHNGAILNEYDLKIILEKKSQYI